MSRLPGIYPPGRLVLREVGLRDGLQMVKIWPDTAAKKEWLRLEHAAGVRHFEIGSFLPASRFPQFADVAQIADVLATLEGAHGAALALNEPGAEAALASSVAEIGCVVSATEEHSMANMHRSRADAVALVATVAAMRDAAAPERIVSTGISMAFGCSIGGQVEQDEVLRLAADCLEAGADLVGIADTVGYAGPRQVARLCDGMRRLCGDTPFVIHLHDTRGLGIANAAAALDHGASIVDASLGGLGGCPFAPGATGNIVFEDLVWLCETMGFPTGIDLDALRAARRVAEESMKGEQCHGALANAGAPGNMNWRAA